MRLKILPQQLVVCKVSDLKEIDWKDECLFICKTDEELSVVCSRDCIPKNYTDLDDGWRGFRIEGQLDFSMIGILAKMSGLLAEHKIGIFVTSTYNTDYILVKETSLERTKVVLEEAGYIWI